MASNICKLAFSLNLDLWKTSDAHVNTHPGCPLNFLYTIAMQNLENKNRKQKYEAGKDILAFLEKYKCHCMTERKGRENEKTWNWAWVFLKVWRIKSRMWKAEYNSGDMYNSERQYAWPGSTLGHEMAARTQWRRERERGIYWDIMDAGAEGGRVRRAGVERCSCKNYPCMILKPNT